MIEYTVTATDKDGNNIEEVRRVFTEWEQAHDYWQTAGGYEVTMTPKVVL